MEEEAVFTSIVSVLGFLTGAGVLTWGLGLGVVLVGFFDFKSDLICYIPTE